MDIWDWLKGLRTWWWMLVVFPLLAASISWIATPEPQYESQWTVNIYFDDPALTNSPAYFDFVLLDDLHLLLETGALGDVMYLRLPEEARTAITREEFGKMFDSSRKAHFVEITVSGDDPNLVTVVAETLNENLEEIANQYLLPPTSRNGQANVNVLDPVPAPQLNERSRMITVGSITGATILVSIAATGVAEWLRRSHRAKYSSR